MANDTVDTCVFLSVTGQTLAHRQSHYLSRLLHCFDGTVTSLALDIGLDMGPVLKKYKIRHRSRCNPLDRLLLIPTVLDILDFRFVRRRNLMTTHAALDRRDPGDGRSTGITVAVLTGDLIFSGVDLMAEGDRLFFAFRAAGAR